MFPRIEKTSLLSDYSKNTDTSSRSFLEILGTFASSAGYPTGKTSIACSWSGLCKISLKNPIGDGVCVSVTKPML